MSTDSTPVAVSIYKYTHIHGYDVHDCILFSLYRLLSLHYLACLNEKTLGETQTLRAGCEGGAKIFRPAADPLPGGGAGRRKFNQLEMVITFTYRPSLVKIDARNFELSW